MARPQPDLERRLAEYFRAVNAHDEEATMSFLAESFVLRHADSAFTADRERFRSMLGWDFGARARIVYDRLEVEGDTVSGYFDETNDFYELSGMGPQRLWIRYRFRNGLIEEQVFRTVPTGGKTFEEALAPIVEWASRHRPEAVAKIYPDGKFVANGQTVGPWLALLRDWREHGRQNQRKNQRD